MDIKVRYYPLLNSSSCPPAVGQHDKDRIMIRFIHISDTHIGPSKDFELQGVNTYNPFQKVLEGIQSLPFQPDFIIHTGDIAADPDRQSYSLFASMVKDIHIPFYYVTGNHDESAMIKSELQIGEKEDLMTDNLVYRFEVSRRRFLVLDGRGPREIDPHGTISDEQFDIIDKELSKDQPLSIFIHFPLLPIDCSWVDRDMLLFEGDRLHDLFAAHAEKINGVFFGHLHRGTTVIKDGVRYSSVASTCLQFGLLPGQDQPTFEDHKRGYFNIVTIEDGKMVVKEQSVKIGKEI